MSEEQFSFEIEALAERVRAFWGEAQHRETKAHVELFAKVSLRSKVARGPSRHVATADHTYESGLAVRLLERGRRRAAFSSSAGLSSEVVRSTMDTARRLGTRVTPIAPRTSDVVASERWDLDAPTAIPAEADLTECVTARQDLEWIEAGTTLEVLVGAGGWLAARRRHRVWALSGGMGAQLVAQRGFPGWERLADAGTLECTSLSEPRSAAGAALVLAPDATSVVAEALVATFHVSDEAHPSTVGRGWVVSDEPAHMGGLAGGTFDDVGFPAASRVLAVDGRWRNAVTGAGTFRRSSFREPPKESVTNLFIPPGDEFSIPSSAAIATRCRIHRTSHEFWVLELDLTNELSRGVVRRRWITVRPESLLNSCAGRLGATSVTALGPIVPWLAFEGLPGTSGEESLS